MKDSTIDAFVMVDIETLNTESDNPCIIQVGTTLARKGPSDWEYKTCTASCRPRADAVDLSTVLWWSTQPNFTQILEASLKSTFSPADAFGACLCELFDSPDMGQAPKGVYLAANPPSFDIVMLRSAYSTSWAKFPFHWAMELDYRTMKRLFGDRRVEAAEIMAELGEGSVAHDAGHDSLLQARAMCLMLDSLRQSQVDSASPVQRA